MYRGTRHVSAKQRAHSEQTSVGTSQSAFPTPLTQSLEVYLVFCCMTLRLPLPHHGFYHLLTQLYEMG